MDGTWAELFRRDTSKRIAGQVSGINGRAAGAAE
jgi:hypothetical protein